MTDGALEQAHFSAMRWNTPLSEAHAELLCIGASHAWGGTTRALEALAPVLSGGGLLLFGDGYWQTGPTPEAEAIFGPEVMGLDAIVEWALADGWRVLSLTTADQREWDEFESSWRLGRERWLRANSQAPNGDEIRRHLGERAREYVTVYRGVLGFVYLVLSR